MGKGPEFLHFGGGRGKMSNGVLLELPWGVLAGFSQVHPRRFDRKDASLVCKSPSRYVVKMICHSSAFRGQIYTLSFPNMFCVVHMWGGVFADVSQEPPPRFDTKDEYAPHTLPKQVFNN